MRANIFKIKKPHDKKLQQTLEVGVGYINLREDGKKGYSQWLYFLRKKKETKAFNVNTAAHNIFMITPKKKMKKRPDKLNKRYSYFEIL